MRPLTLVQMSLLFWALRCIAFCQTPEVITPSLRLVAQAGNTAPYSVALSTDGRLAVTAGGNLLSLWNTTSARIIWTVSIAGSLSRLEFSYDSRFILAVTNGRALVLKTDTGFVTAQVIGPSQGSGWVQFAPRDPLLLVGGFYTPPEILDLTAPRELPRRQGAEALWGPVAYSTDGSLFAYISADNRIIVNNRHRAKPFSLEPQPSAISALSFDIKGSLLADGDVKGVLRTWSITGKKTPHVMNGHAGAIHSLAFAPSGDTLLAGSTEGSARLWSVATGQLMKNCDPTKALLANELFTDVLGYTVKQVLFHPSGKYFIVQSRVVQFWNSLSLEPDNPFESQVLSQEAAESDVKAPITQEELAEARSAGTLLPRLLALSRDAKHMIATYGFGGGLGTYVSRSQSDVFGIRLQPSMGSSLQTVLSSDEKTLAAVYDDARVRVWDLRSSKILSTPSYHGSVISLDSFSNDTLLSTGMDGTIRLINPKKRETKELIYNPTGRPRGPREADKNVAASFVGQAGKVISITRAGDLLTWNIEDRRATILTHLRLTSTRSHLRSIPSTNLMGLENGGTVTIMDFDGNTQSRIGGNDSPAVLSRDGKYVLHRRGSFQHPEYELLESDGLGVRAHWQIDAWAYDLHNFAVFRRYNHELIAILSWNGQMLLHDLDTGSEEPVATAPLGARIEGYLNSLDRLVVSEYEGAISLIDVGTGEWRLRFYVRGDVNKQQSQLAGTIPAGRDHVLIVEPSGHFDTTDFEDGVGVSWVVPDDPFNPLPVEIFTRDYYTPKLLAKLVSGVKLPDVRPLASLNRSQPKVTVVGVYPEPDFDRVTVSVKLTSAPSKVQRDAEHRTLQSGAYDLRLFRDGQLVGQSPGGANGEMSASSVDGLAELDRWRRQHRILSDGETVISIPHVQVPHRKGVSQVVFTAYAFNSDRVKSEISEPFPYEVRVSQPRGRRAYLITMTVNANQSGPGWDLKLAVPSGELAAQLWTKKLLQDYEVVPVILKSETDDRGVVLPNPTATKSSLQAVLDILAGREQRVSAASREAIDPKGRLRTATPDDAVVLYVASHGYADPQGKFYVIPFDTPPRRLGESLLNQCAQRGDSVGCSDAQAFLNHSVSSYDLGSWWQGVDAGELVMILDSCHSAAVPGQGFRAGPLGDPGFGQLSFDKGMRILAATQPDKTAIATEGLGHTLLVEALKNALQDRMDQSITAWLEAAERQLPTEAHKLAPNLKLDDLQLPEFMNFRHERPEPKP
jgi:WD40 repeat protein